MTHLRLVIDNTKRQSPRPPQALEMFWLGIFLVSFSVGVFIGEITKRD